MRASLRTNLLAAIGAVAAVTAIASGISAYVFANTETRLLLVLRKEMPAITLALKLAEASRRYSNGAASLISAQNQMQRQSINIGLGQQADSIRSYLFQLHLYTTDLSRFNDIERLINTLTDGLAKENAIGESLFELQDLDKKASSWVAQHQENYIIILSRLFDSSAAGPPQHIKHIINIRKEGAKLLMKLNQEVQATEIDQTEEISKYITLYINNLSMLENELPFIDNEMVSLRKWINELLYGDHNVSNILSIKKSFIMSRIELHNQAAINQLTSSRLSLSIGTLVDSFLSEAAATGEIAEHDIEISRSLMIAIAVLSFLGPVVFVWLIVGRTIVKPLTALANSTQRIASGDLQAPIPDGTGEIAAMGEALRVFRNNTAILAERTTALTASETRLLSTLEAEKNAREHAERVVAELEQTQEQLIRAEKLAALGGLVAGVAHEINTPLGVTVTTSSIVSEKITTLRDLALRGNLRRSDFNHLINEANEASDLLVSNLNRAARLIQAFKQIAVDQSCDERRIFNLKACLEDLITSLKPSWHRSGHKITINCPDWLELDSFPGALDQIITNLVMNSVVHGFEPEIPGNIEINVFEREPNDIEIQYKDDGKGIPNNLLNRVFDPFFTTKRSHGSTGLGLHIVYNLVSAKLCGNIDVRSAPKHGVEFRLLFPKITHIIA